MSTLAPADRLQELALLVNEAVAAARHQLEEARLALHILRQQHFGPLNDQQAELIDAARTAADNAETEMLHLQQVARLDGETDAARHDDIRPGDMMRSLQAQLQADGARIGVTVSMQIAPGLPRVRGDRTRLQQALEFVLRHIVRHAPPGATVAIETDRAPSAVRIVVRGGPAPTLDADVALGRRIIEAQGGSITVREGETVITMVAAP